MTEFNTREWLDGLKVGDAVLVVGGHTTFIYGVVVSVAPKRITVQEEGRTSTTRFDKKTGLIWGFLSLIPDTQQARDAYLAKVNHEKRVGDIRRNISAELSPDTLSQLEAVLVANGGDAYVSVKETA
jgi:preprotein translocase subunit YajC